jgi:hypothetical protein
VKDGDQPTESTVREAAQEIIREELKGQIDRVIGAVEAGRKWHERAAVATVLSAFIAVIALLISAFAFVEGSKREADVAASEALMTHFDYATQQGVSLGREENNASSLDSEYKLVATHGIYTANTIVDITEGTDERVAWRNTALGLLDDYEGFISKNGLPCDELDGHFVTLTKEHFDFGKNICNGA